MDSIRKYIGGDKINPKLNKLGSKDWENTKARVKKEVEQVARPISRLRREAVDPAHIAMGTCLLAIIQEVMGELLDNPAVFSKHEQARHRGMHLAILAHTRSPDGG